jgi:hypothetical protein
MSKVTASPTAFYTPPTPSNFTDQHQDWREATGFQESFVGVQSSVTRTAGTSTGHTANVASYSMNSSAEQQSSNDIFSSMAVGDEEADEDDDDDDLYSNSTELAISAAKGTPLLNLSSAEVGAMTESDVNELTLQHAGMQLIQKMIISSVQPAMQSLQTQLTEAHEIIARQAQAHEDIVNQFQQLQVSAQHTSTSITELHARSNAVELRELAKEFRELRRTFQSAQADHEDLEADLSKDPDNSNLQRRTKRAGVHAQKIYTDMQNVLITLNNQCNTYGQLINNFVQQEDIDLLTTSSHVG